VPTFDSPEERNVCENPGGGSPNPTGGTNPVLLTTGTKYETEEDFATADQRLVVGRQYRSFQSGGATVYQTNPLGLGDYWRLTFGYELHIKAPFGSWNALTLHVPDGACYDFRRDTTGALVSTEDDAGQIAISLALDGAWPTDLNTLTDSSTRWRVTLPDNRVVTLETVQPSGSTEFTVARPVTIADLDGYTQTFRYDALGALQTITDNLGRTLTFTWLVLDPSLYGGTSAPRPLAVARIVFPDGAAVRYGYDMSSAAASTLPVPLPERLIRVDYVDAAGAVVGTKTYQYEDARFPWALTGITDERGVRVASWTYDAQGKTLTSEHAGGVDRYTVAYTDTFNSATRTVTNPLGKSTTYQFSRNGDTLRLTTVTGQPSSNCVGTTRQMTYDTQGFMQQTVDEEGNSTRYTYNDRGLPTQIVEAFGKPEARTTTIIWHSTWRLPTKITEPGLETTFTYDSTGRPNEVRQTDPATGEIRSWRYSYTLQGLLAAVDGPLPGTADTVTYAYDAKGYLSKVTNEIGQVTSIMAVNGRGQPTRIVDPNGVGTALSYDARGRLTLVTLDTAGAQESWRVSYTASGQVTRITRPDSSYLEYT
jgi:YD repeat-containing protein